MAEKQVTPTFDSVMADLKAGKFMPTYLLMGDESYYIDKISDYIAENVTANVRQLEGTLNKILAYRDLLGDKVDQDAVGRAVKDMLKRSNEFVPSPQVIISYVSKYYNIDTYQR